MLVSRKKQIIKEKFDQLGLLKINPEGIKKIPKDI